MEAQLGAKASLLLLSTLFLLSTSRAADPDPLQDFCIADLQGNGASSVNGFLCKPADKVVADDFFFNGLAKPGSTKNIFGSNVTGANVLSFPGVNTLGISMNRVDFAPGGLNPPHSHPRATELVLVLKGELLVGFVTTTNVFYSKVLKEGENFVIPPGLVHFQLNVGKGTALIITTFNSQNPGVVISPLTLFGSSPAIPDEVLTKAFQVDPTIIRKIKSKFGN